MVLSVEPDLWLWASVHLCSTTENCQYTIEHMINEAHKPESEDIFM